MTSRQSRTTWQKHFDDWSNSGMTQPDYCKQHNISIASFGFWRTKLKREANTEIKQTKKLVPVTINNNSNIIQVALPGGIQMSVPIQLLAETLVIISRNQRTLTQ